MKNAKRIILLLAVALVLPLTAAPAMADDGTGALGYIPKDTMMVVGINVDSLKKTDIFKDFMKAVMADNEAKAGIEMLKKSTGFDPEKDVSSLVISVPPDVESSQNFLMVVKGKFDEKKFVKFAKDEAGDGWKKMTHQKVTWYEIEGEGGMAFVGDYVIVGTKASVKASIDTHKAKSDSVKKNKTVNGLIKAVDTKGDLWMALSLPASIRKEMGAQNPMAGDIEDAHASLDLGKGMKLRLTLGTSSADTAGQLVELAKAGLQGAGSDPQVKALGLDAAINNLKLNASSADVNIELDLNQAEFDKIKNTLQGLVQGSMR